MVVFKLFFTAIYLFSFPLRAPDSLCCLVARHLIRMVYVMRKSETNIKRFCQKHFDKTAEQFFITYHSIRDPHKTGTRHQITFQDMVKQEECLKNNHRFRWCLVVCDSLFQREGFSRIILRRLVWWDWLIRKWKELMNQTNIKKCSPFSITIIMSEVVKGCLIIFILYDYGDKGVLPINQLEIKK